MAKVDQKSNGLGLWQRRLSELANDVKAWATAQKWRVTSRREERSEEGIASYAVEVLEIQTSTGTVVLEPIGLQVLGASGRVDLTAWPSLNRVKLVPDPKDGWSIYTDSNIPWPKPWGKETFIDVAKALAESK